MLTYEKLNPQGKKGRSTEKW